VAACQDVACTSAVLRTLDASAAAGGPTSLAFGPDGRALIAYVDGGTQAVRVAHCADAGCSSATFSALGPGHPSSGARIAFGTDGLALVQYAAPGPGGVRMAHCADADCAIAQVTAYPTTPSFGLSLVIGGDGRGLFAASNFVGHCADVACTAATFVFLQNGPVSGPTGFHYEGPSLAVGADGLGRLAITRVLHSTPDLAIGVWKCRDASCSALDGAGAGASYSTEPALTVLPSGWLALAHVTQIGIWPQALFLSVCAEGCVTRTLEEVVTYGHSLAISPPESRSSRTATG
jgi:hypothetical protein